MARPDSEHDLLMELASHPGWRVLRKEAKQRMDSHTEAIKGEANSDFDLIKKEVRIGKIVELQEFLQMIENLVDTYARHK